MRVFIILMAILLLPGCATYSDWQKTRKEARIEGWRAECEAIGATLDQMVPCLMMKEAIHAMESANRSHSVHHHQQILNHGAGGCTPNFSTGGCL